MNPANLVGRTATPRSSTYARVAAGISTALFVTIMTVSGVLYLVGPKPLMDALRELGYPVYFFKLLGLAKLLGVIGLLAPRRPILREWAYAGFTFDLTAAVASHLATGGASHLPPALFAFALLLMSYLSRRRVAAEANA